MPVEVSTNHTTHSLYNFQELPGYARFIIANCKEEYIQLQLQHSYEMEIPLLKFFLQFSHEQRYALTQKTITDFLNYLANNRAAEQIETSLQQWKTNQLPVVDKQSIVAEDITLVNYMRKKTLQHFITQYTQDPLVIMKLVNEIDFFIIQSITAATNLFIDLFKERLDEHAHFIQKVNETIPGAVYVFDTEQYKGIYSNNKLPYVIGYDHADLNALGESAIASLIHPDDQAVLLKQGAIMEASADGEIHQVKYRIKKPDGSYKWLSTYESVFKRKEDDTVWQTIGITLDIDKEQNALEDLYRREQQLVEAQDIAQLGNFYWDFENESSTASQKTLDLLEITEAKFENLLTKVHPDDREKLETEARKAFATGDFNCEYRIQSKKGDKLIWARGLVDFKNGKPAGMTGTIMDVTEHNQLVRQLEQADQRHKQAEALTHIGTYTWKLSSKEMEWSDEMYRIFEWDPSTQLHYQNLLAVIHKDDKNHFVEIINTALDTKKPYNFYFRIITSRGVEKIIHSRGQAEVNEAGIAVKLVGTDQDVTERQTLIQDLRKSEALYKQAESLARMGNWTWEVTSGKLEWTDELYRIYGMDPQEEPITIERFLSFVHPGDRSLVEKGIDSLLVEATHDYTFRIIAKDGTQKWLRSLAQTFRDDTGKINFIVGTEQDVTEKEQLIERLKESEKLYKQAQSLTHMGNWTWDLLTNKSSWSDELFEIYELPEGQTPTQEEWLSFLPDAEREKLLQTFKESVENRKPMDVTHQLILPNGKHKTLHRKGEVIYNDAGQAIKLTGTTQDVTDVYKIQAELKDSQTFIRKITDATPSIIASYNVNSGTYTFISEGLNKLLGYDTAEVIEKGASFFVALTHPDDLKSLIEKNAKALEEANAKVDKMDVVVEFTCRMKHKNGHYRWFHTYGTIFDRNKEGKVEHILNISLDVTDQQQAIETIKEQEYFIQQIADASPTILYLFDVPSQRFAYINREAFFVLGYLPDEIVEEGNGITDLLYHPDDMELLPCRSQSKRSFQQVDSMIQYECRMKHKDGEFRWLLVREIVFKTDADGAITQIIGAALDINRRKEMEKTILQNTLQLEQSNASLEEFAYVASHDLKEPLRKISTFGDRLVASHLDKLNDDGKVYLRKIIDASQRMQNMISDLLSISMISGNRSYENYSLEKILEETLQTLEVKIEQLNALILHGPLPDARIVPLQFRQLFQNLISNSLKFVREGVQPEISIDCTIASPDEVVAYQVAKAESYFKIVFSDNGIGFEKEYAQKIFAIFQRLHGRSEYEGSGIGLAICKKIVEHHGGVIFASGRPLSGATFTIILPV